MYAVSIKILRTLALPIIILLFSGSGFSQDLSDARAVCNDLTPEKRSMAKAAGYDVDRLCRSLDGIAPRAALESSTVSASMPRATASSASPSTAADVVAPMAVSGNMAVAKTSTLKPFGYDLFANVPSSFAASTNIPVSPDYLLGPGDELEIIFYGKLNKSFSVKINRDGLVDFPELGPVGIAGLSYGEAKDMLQSLIAAKVIGTQVNISMGALKSMQIFVLGEAYKPGAYTVSSLSTITHALISAGGVSDIASLRNIQLKRAGKVVAVLDLYELLLSGNTANDMRLQSSDVIYIPTVGGLVSIDGQVLRPAIYELKGETTTQDLIDLAGGLGPKAFAQSARIERINGDGFMTVVDLDLSAQAGQSMAIAAGDHLRVDAISDYRKDIVSLVGHVNHPGDFSWRSGMRLSDLISSTDQFPPDVDLDYALVIRDTEGGLKINVKELDLRSVLQKPNSAADFELYSRDKVMIFSAFDDRHSDLSPLLELLYRQAALDESAKVVSVAGMVRFPGEYPLSKGMSVKDLITAAGGLSEGAYLDSAEITRSDFSDPQKALVIIRDVSLHDSADNILQPLDELLVKTKPDYRERETITLSGEVMFPGTYSLFEGETLSTLIERAGGFTDAADIDASVFTRMLLKEREQRELDELRQRLNDALSAEQLQEVNAGIKVDAKSQEVQRRAIAQLNSVEAIGRLVVPLEKVVSGKVDDVLLEDGDQLFVPKQRQEVTILGEVQRPSSYFYDRGISVKALIAQSGGLLDSADRRGIYLIKSSGKIELQKRRFLPFLPKRIKVEAGDTIIVPLDTNDSRIQGIPLLAEVSKIVYQLALGAAAINSLNP
jgi:protein involved in polysaccharide export with SLBB domain